MFVVTDTPNRTHAEVTSIENENTLSDKFGETPDEVNDIGNSTKRKMSDTQHKINTTLDSKLPKIDDTHNEKVVVVRNMRTTFMERDEGEEALLKFNTDINCAI